LLVFTGGFGTDPSQYTQFCEALAAGGCAVLRYEVPGANTATDDALVVVLRSLLAYARSSPVLQRLVSTERVLLAGHSRGAKLSSLLAVADESVAGLCLLDPIDNTIWAPLSPGFPSACDALRQLDTKDANLRPLPVAIIGAGLGGDCAPVNSNYDCFYEAIRRLAWLIVIPTAGHAQFLDPDGLGQVQRTVCGRGKVDDALVREIAAAVCLAWADVTVGPLPVVTAETELAAAGARGPGSGALLRQQGSADIAARAEISRVVRRLQMPGAAPLLQQTAISINVAATVTIDGLRRRGVAVESSLKL